MFVHSYAFRAGILSSDAGPQDSSSIPAAAVPSSTEAHMPGTRVYACRTFRSARSRGISNSGTADKFAVASARTVSPRQVPSSCAKREKWLRKATAGRRHRSSFYSQQVCARDCVAAHCCPPPQQANRSKTKQSSWQREKKENLGNVGGDIK